MNDKIGMQLPGNALASMISFREGSHITPLALVGLTIPLLAKLKHRS